jgi:DNA polymerase III subunit epsilon
MLTKDLITAYRQISQQDLTIIDLETTGYAPPMARAIEISIIHANLADGVQRQETHLINPGVRVPEPITRYTGISQAMVTKADAAADVWPHCFPLLDQGRLTAHNISFDYSFIKYELQQQGIEFSRTSQEQFCTVIFSRLMLPELPSRSLPNLVQHFGFDVGRSHRAAADTMACWLLAERLLREVNDRSDDELLSRFGQQWLTMKDVAKMMGCRQQVALRKLTVAGLEPRISSRSKTTMYRRSDVERLVAELAAD